MLCQNSSSTLAPIQCDGPFGLLVFPLVGPDHSPLAWAAHHRAPADEVLLKEGLYAVPVIHVATEDVFHRLQHLLPAEGTHCVYLYLSHLQFIITRLHPVVAHHLNYSSFNKPCSSTTTMFPFLPFTSCLHSSSTSDVFLHGLLQLVCCHLHLLLLQLLFDTTGHQHGHGHPGLYLPSER